MENVTSETRIRRMKYRDMLYFLKQTHLSEFAKGMKPAVPDTKPAASAAPVVATSGFA